MTSLHTFMSDLNSFHPALHFTYEFSLKTVNFLDLTIFKSPNFLLINYLDTSTYQQPQNLYQYLHYNSKTIQKGLIFGECIRYLRTNTIEHNFSATVHMFSKREYLSKKKSVVKQHVQSVKHGRGKCRLAKKEEREKNIDDMLVKYDSDVHPVGEGLPYATRVYRIRVITTFMKAGVPLQKVDSFRELLEENAFRLSDSSNLRELVPIIHKDAQATVRNEIDGKKVSVIFDGTILSEFVKVWINMFSRSPKTKLAWSTKTGLPAPTY